MATTKKFVAKNGLDNNNLPIVNVGDPQNDQDVATKRSVDTVIAIEATARAAAVASVQANLDAEVTARESATSSSQTVIDSEVTARTNADTTLQTNIDAEATSRTNADATLQANINAETTARVAAVDAEVTARTNAVSTVQASLDTEVTARIAAVNTETTARANADTTLQANIDAEVTARSNAVSTLQANIDSLDTIVDALGNVFNYIGVIDGGSTTQAALDMSIFASGQKDAGDYFKVGLAGYFKVGAGGTPFFANSGDGLVWNTASGVDIIDNTNSTVAGTADFIAVTGSADTGFVVDVDNVFKTRVGNAESNILVEKTARTNADTSLQNAIDTEATSRTSADTALQNNINTEITARTNAVSTVQGNVDAEASARAAADTTLQANIDTKQDSSTAITTSNIGSQVVASAATLTTGRTVALTGDVTYTSGAFNGSANVTGTATLANSGATAGTYGDATNIPQIAVDVKGRITSVSNVAVSIPSGSLTFTGDVTGTGSTGSSTALNLASVGTAGTYTKVTTDAKGRVTSGTTLAASDIPNLDAAKITSGIIDAARLPSYVDDVLEFANLAGFPGTGETGKLYVALDTNKVYRWSGSVYIFITSGAVDSVAGKTGVVTLAKGDVGLGSVDNTADSTKNVLSATKLTTARTVTLSGDVSGSVSFDGSSNVTISTTVAANSVALGTDTTGNYVASLVAGTGISVGGAGEGATPTITNTAPDQTVVLTGSGATSVSGTYPNFTISSTDTNTTYTAGNGLALSGTTFNVGAGSFITVAADTIAVDATSTNTGSKVVARDANGDFAGRIITAVDFNATSDARLKSNVETISNVSEVLMQLRPVSYTMNSTGKKSYGVIAQEIVEVLPELVNTDQDGMMSVSYTPLIALLIETVQSQQKTIADMKSRLDKLESK